MIESFLIESKCLSSPFRIHHQYTREDIYIYFFLKCIWISDARITFKKDARIYEQGIRNFIPLPMTEIINKENSTAKIINACVNILIYLYATITK